MVGQRVGTRCQADKNGPARTSRNEEIDKTPPSTTGAQGGTDGPKHLLATEHRRVAASKRASAIARLVGTARIAAAVAEAVPAHLGAAEASVGAVLAAVVHAGHPVWVVDGVDGEAAVAGDSRHEIETV